MQAASDWLNSIISTGPFSLKVEEGGVSFLGLLES